MPSSPPFTSRPSLVTEMMSRRGNEVIRMKLLQPRDYLSLENYQQIFLDFSDFNRDPLNDDTDLKRMVGLNSTRRDLSNDVKVISLVCIVVKNLSMQYWRWIYTNVLYFMIL